MKTTVITLFAATLLGSASLMSNYSIDAAGFLAIAFAAGLVAWTASEYGRETPLPKRRAKTLAFTIPASAARTGHAAGRMAA
ncbi:MAG TPA: hypothetical protein VMM36_18765 [Opitutaceae bacterium]|nr:hypothetical protein [Opitutaceae bacterium]